MEHIMHTTFKSVRITNCDRILENLPFGHIGQSDVIIHISQETFSVKFHRKMI